MKFNTLVLPHFKKQLKAYCKKYRRLKETTEEILENFYKNQGIYLGNRLYKIRIATKDIPRGKSKSFRLIILLLELDTLIIPVTIYFKGDKENISNKEINQHLEIILDEMNRK